MIGSFPKILNVNPLFVKLNRFIVTNCRFFPIIAMLGRLLCRYLPSAWQPPPDLLPFTPLSTSLISHTSPYPPSQAYPLPSLLSMPKPPATQPPSTSGLLSKQHPTLTPWAQPGAGWSWKKGAHHMKGVGGVRALFKIEVSNALQMRFGLSKYTLLKTQT